MRPASSPAPPLPIALKRLGGYGVLVCACILAWPARRAWLGVERSGLAARPVAAGFAFAMLFAATDTAVLDAADIEHRSRAIGIYVSVERLSMMVMPFAFAGRLSSPPTLIYGVLCLWMALIPGRTRLRAHPATNGWPGVLVHGRSRMEACSKNGALRLCRRRPELIGTSPAAPLGPQHAWRYGRPDHPGCGLVRRPCGAARSGLSLETRALPHTVLACGEPSGWSGAGLHFPWPQDLVWRLPR